MYIPRIGQEVIVEFLEGDPDQPIITGRVYNAQAMPPYDLPDNKTMSTLKSDSSKGSGGFNEIRFEDKKGDEQIFIHAEKNIDIRVKNDRFETVSNNRHLHVEKDKFEHVDNNRDEKVDADHKEEIGKDRHLKVVGKEAKEVGGSQSLTVKGDVIEVFKANHSEQTTQNYYLKAMGVVIEAMQGITLKCGGSSVVLDPASVTVKGGMVTIDGGMTKINSGPGSPPTAGQAGSAVAPAAITAALDADKADPGEVTEVKAKQLQTKTGKYGSTPVKPHKPDEEKKSWIEIEMVDEDNKPVPGEAYKITLPDGSVAEGTLDGNGFARINGTDQGNCQITFPELDKEAWEKA
jgi:type VI secretion system secreted protein VgrG